VGFIGLFPIAVRLGDPLFSYPFRTGWQYEYPVLLVWPDHVEMRWFHAVSEVSPRPANAHYTFNVAPERQAWVENKVRTTPAPNGADAAWIIHIMQLGPSRQQIQLELMGDGITGLIYEVRGDEIVPLRSRLAGPLSSLSILIVLLLLWGGVVASGMARFAPSQTTPQTTISRSPRVVGETSPFQCAGMNRHEVEDERALRERSSDPLGPESCTATVRDTAKRRQGIGGVGIQLRYIQEKKGD
jgi:hypothetical protein